ncbi:hypothetical protein ACOTWR_06180 [Aliarcobacter butzleri]|uniref:hypothetical protein n=1 Tax=Aliarcobacter butzleri TaxID=28197 RepID=UPI0021B2FEE1|nr:hypothetical protein [Aliarcobacter butzleri]MCT7563164.1 hypothetical protein [Aliarcobacter butzleri]MCT7578639.1 hypothetical protein [Aliarcobacter butzleri]MCT7647580.1 hypothetical protein [Aliarcobacter butzleri]
MIKNIMLIGTIIFLFSGCLMIGKQEFACKNGEDLKDAGICGSSMYILKNKKNIAEDSYRNFSKERGTYNKCEDEEDCEENKIKEKRMKEQW